MQINSKIPTRVGGKKWAGQRLVRTLLVGVLMSGIGFGHVAPAMAAAAPGQPVVEDTTRDIWDLTGRIIQELQPDGSVDKYLEIKNRRTGKLDVIYVGNFDQEPAEPADPTGPGIPVAAE